MEEKMKRFWFLLMLVFMVSACTVEVTPLPTSKVVVTPATQAVAPGPAGKVDLKAALDNGTTSEFTWEVPTGSSFESLTPDNSSIRLTAPTATGTYTVKATAKNSNSTPAEAQIIVDVLLSGEAKTATIDPPTAPPAPIVTANIAVGGTNYFTVTVPADVAASGKAFYIDAFPTAADVPLRLTVFSADRKAYASSISKNFFALGETALPAAQGLAPATITPGANICLGSCVIQSAKADTFYVRITNPQSTAIQYQLFAFVSGFGDANEDANNAVATATSLTTTEVGAIEELGDVDYYRVSTAGRTLRFNATVTDLGLQAIVTRSGTILATLTNTQTAAVQVGDIIEVKSTNNRAADSNKRYNVELF
jgi:hypothetical protein